jgi:GntR family transcriptional regulator/MocR family aminotransferase
LAAQAALAEFIDSGGLARHIRRMRHTYRVRHQRIVAMLNGPLSRWLQLIPSSAGLHVSAYLRESAVGPVAAEVLAQASATGVEVFDFAMFDPVTAPPRGVVFGYGGIPTDRVDEGLHHLYNLFAKIG